MGLVMKYFILLMGKKKRRSPVEVGSFILLFTRFRTSEVVVWDFWTYIQFGFFPCNPTSPISSSAFFLVYNPTSSTSSSLNFPGGFATSPVTRLNSVLLKKRTFQGMTGTANVAGVCRKKRKGEESIICQKVHCSTQWHRGLLIVKGFTWKGDIVMYEVLKRYSVTSIVRNRIQISPSKDHKYDFKPTNQPTNQPTKSLKTKSIGGFYSFKHVTKSHLSKKRPSSQ